MVVDAFGLDNRAEKSDVDPWATFDLLMIFSAIREEDFAEVLGTVLADISQIAAVDPSGCWLCLEALERQFDFGARSRGRTLYGAEKIIGRRLCALIGQLSDHQIVALRKWQGAALAEYETGGLDEYADPDLLDQMRAVLNWLDDFRPA